MEYIFAEEFEFILTWNEFNIFSQISNRTTFFQYRSMSGGRFLVSLTEVSTSEKKLACRSLLKVGDNYWMQEEPEHTGNWGTMWMLLFKNLSYINQQLWGHHCAMTVNSWHLLPRNFKLKIICQLCSIPMTSHNEHSVSREEVYLDRGSLTLWLTNPSDELSNFLCSVPICWNWSDWQTNQFSTTWSECDVPDSW